ncbi:ribosomal protein S5 domain 2-like protein [Dacryopinax primogenitus]|uniref:Ribosomal RNA-processing protein 41 n=1 Tax=Dacryopinax primogenitus (strain DJM 731) TaxID=1858805 RepID=M5G8P3_DACPD|nr:ribosomal protein S5 domain 2-like protein [Dacryopinax primogenitus]EJU04550.1 ribosomal protein S5 domain 2-like protein [Dacryopinax primogenitus]
MSRFEPLNAGNLRSDGRRPLELRSFSAELTTHPSADGSASVSHGLTQVTACVYGPREAKNRAQTMHDRALVNIEVEVAPWAGEVRRQRTKGDRRTAEFAASVKATFEPVIQTTLYPRSEIDIHIHVLQLDGGLLQAGINATTLALVDAGIPMLDYVSSLSAGLYHTTAMLDLTNLEESDLPSVTVAVLPRSGKVTLVSMETRLHVDRFEEMFKLAMEGGKVLRGEMDKVVRERTKVLARQMEGGAAQDEDRMETDDL